MTVFFGLNMFICDLPKVTIVSCENVVLSFGDKNNKKISIIDKIIILDKKSNDVVKYIASEKIKIIANRTIIGKKYKWFKDSFAININGEKYVISKKRMKLDKEFDKIFKIRWSYPDYNDSDFFNGFKLEFKTKKDMIKFKLRYS